MKCMKVIAFYAKQKLRFPSIIPIILLSSNYTVVCDFGPVEASYSVNMTEKLRKIAIN